ncbi:hypothetical protein INS49_003235 [Diaporthe citri]|uniref:uncharacterized protein n=1 Tax=Diaporthe citri TaxID=83186 RepID=UPI001C7E24C7|nr:uncharacterized protein INS49_003235 [Diaporthe citri]KAG6355274.1 hypothetical protein INS49_003235 [Diaporthe citri]
MPSKTIAAALLLCLLSPLVAGHAAIVRATGDAGGQGMALGIDTATPRDGTRRNPFQQDSTRFKGQAADTVGETLAGGDNDVEAGTTAIMGETGEALPQVTQGGEVQMTLHQVNGDGGGPYIRVTDMPPGENSRSRDTQTSEQALTAAVPANQACTGTVAGQDNVCLVRCMNDANAGPFGGVVPVQMVQAATAGNATAGAAPPAAAKAEARRSFARYVAAREKELQKLKKRSY